jgi:hypothetical protein
MPDQHLRRAPLPVAILTAFFFAPIAPENTIPMDWQGSRPDFAARGVVPQPVSNLTEFAYVPAVSRWGLDALPWLPVYPDFAGRGPEPLRTEVYTEFLSFDPFPVAPPAPDLSWSPTFPDFARVAQPNTHPAFVFFDPFPIPEAPALSWAPTYPDTVPGRAPLVPPPFLSFNPDPIAPPVPPLAWAPVYPGPVRTLPGLAAADQQALAFDPFPATPYEPTVDWLPKFPDFPGQGPIPLPVSLLTSYAHVGLTDYPSFTAFAAPFYFDAEAWPPDQAFYLEFYGRATTGTVFAAVAPESSGIPVAASLVSTASTSFERLRSVGFRLSTGTYRLMLGKVAGDAGEAMSARILAVA